MPGAAEQGRAGVAALRTIIAGARDAGVAEGRIAIDPSIARGLDYYTGIVLESFLDELPALGEFGQYGLRSVVESVTWKLKVKLDCSSCR